MGTVDELVLGVYHSAPDLVEVQLFPLLAFLEDDLHRCGRGREAQRLGKRPVHRLGLIGGDPFAKNRAEAARIQETAAGLIVYLEEVVAKIGVVDRLGQISRPGQRLDDDAVNAEHLLGCVSGVVIVQAHGGGSRGEDERTAEQQGR